MAAPPASASPRPASPSIQLHEPGDDAAAVARPRGRLAARMQILDSGSESSDSASSDSNAEEDTYNRVKSRLESAKNNFHDDGEVSTTNPGSEEEEDDGNGSDNAYERVKRRLMAVKPGPEVPPGPISQTQSVAANTRGVPLPSIDDTMGFQTGEVSPIADSNFTPARTSGGDGLFVSPSPGKPNATRSRRSRINSDDSSDDSDRSRPIGRLQALIVRRREERLALEKARAEVSPSATESESEGIVRAKSKNISRISKAVDLKEPKELHLPSSDGESDPEDGTQLANETRPTRKASKKAIEEMKRETQRMTRNMQLTHAITTKTRFTTTDLFKKFNFRQDSEPDSASKDVRILPTAADPSSSSPERVASDGEMLTRTKDTPPSSPPAAYHPTDDKHPVRDLTELATGPADRPSSGHSRYRIASHFQFTGAATEIDSAKSTKQDAMRSNVRKTLPLTKSVTIRPQSSDSDSDLEIVKPQTSERVAAFEKLPITQAGEVKSNIMFRALAQIREREKETKRSKRVMAPMELQALLRLKARQQAMVEKQEKIQMLRDKGIIVQSREDKERDQLQLESMLEKARQEAEELRKKEKEAQRREGRPDDEERLPDSEDEDEDWDSELDGAEDGASGSEADAGEEVDDGEEDQGLFDDAAVESSGESDSEDQGSTASDTEEVIMPTDTGATTSFYKRRQRQIVESDDEGELASTQQDPLQAVTPARRALMQTPRSATAAAFGFSKVGSPSLGLSQVFAGTMAESQGMMGESQQNSLAFLQDSAPMDIIDFGAVFAGEAEHGLVQDSPIVSLEEDSFGLESNSNPVVFDSQSQIPFPGTQLSDIFDATQDLGFQTIASPVAKEPPASYSTIATQPLTIPAPNTSTETFSRNRLQRGPRIQVEASDLTSMELTAKGVDETATNSNNAFAIMRDATRERRHADFDRKRSKAKGMVEEQAEESEDEYAGLGGASDDESGGEMDEDTRKMINDEGGERINERELAAFYADKERAEDEKRVEKLFKDIANGGLRRKRGADLDLWDSDDEDEAATRRRAAKQREFAKMRRALLADEKIGKIAENPKQAAFLQAIEDRDEEEGLDFLDQPEEPSQIPESQRDGGAVLAVSSGNARKRRFSEQGEQQASQEENRAPANLRRGGKTTRPTTLMDIRNTLSEIIGEPEPGTGESINETSQSEDEQEASEETLPDAVITEVAGTPPTAYRRTAASAQRNQVIDRIALRRSRTRDSSTGGSSTGDGRMAFFAASKAGGSFKTPSLLRRATTQASSEGEGRAAGPGPDRSGGFGARVIKMGGSKKSSVNYHVREAERRQKVQAMARERSEGQARAGKMRRHRMALGALGGGTFG